MSFSLPNAENWQDFSLAYVPAVNAFKNGFLPYKDFYYPYPPLFLYALTLPSYLPLQSWSIALLVVLADALAVIPVYLIAKEFINERISLLISILFILAPVNLYYVDYLWLNPSLTMLFLMVSIYFLIKRHYDLSALTLALSIGFKQTALLALPIMILVLWKRESKIFEALRFLFVTVSILFLVSLPYAVLSPALYLESIARIPLYLCGSSQSLPPNYCSIAVGTGSPISIDTLNQVTSRWQLVASGINNPATLSLPFFIFFLPANVAWFYPSSYSIVIWILVACYVFLLYRTKTKQSFEVKESLEFVLYGFLLLLAFYPTYKYYVVGIIPMLVLLVRDKKGLAGFFAFNLLLMFIPRYLTSWVLLISLLWLLNVKFHRRILTYFLAALSIILLASIPLVATSTVVFTNTIPHSVSICPSGNTSIDSNINFSESCVLLPRSSTNQSSYIESSKGAFASFRIVSNSSLPFDVSIQNNSNGSILFTESNVIHANSSIILANGQSYSLILKNEVDTNNTITVSSDILLDSSSATT